MTNIGACAPIIGLAVTRLRIGPIASAITDRRACNTSNEAAKNRAFSTISAAGNLAADNRAQRSANQTANDEAIIIAGLCVAWLRMANARLRVIVRLNVTRLSIARLNIAWLCVTRLHISRLDISRLDIARLNVVGARLDVVSSGLLIVRARLMVGVRLLIMRPGLLIISRARIVILGSGLLIMAVLVAIPDDRRTRKTANDGANDGAFRPCATARDLATDHGAKTGPDKAANDLIIIIGRLILVRMLVICVVGLR